MRKVLVFSLFLLTGLAVSQMLPMLIGDAAVTVKSVTDVLLYVCLAFIMINVGREFEIDKSRWKSYALDYFIAMITEDGFYSQMSLTSAVAPPPLLMMNVPPFSMTSPVSLLNLHFWSFGL